MFVLVSLGTLAVGQVQFANKAADQGIFLFCVGMASAASSALLFYSRASKDVSTQRPLLAWEGIVVVVRYSARSPSGSLGRGAR